MQEGYKKDLVALLVADDQVHCTTLRGSTAENSDVHCGGVNVRGDVQSLNVSSRNLSAPAFAQLMIRQSPCRAYGKTAQHGMPC